MSNKLNNQGYNPDVLSCLANLSSDEVFTPPLLVNEMLDQLPNDIWKDPEIKFLDPGCKSGVFLREITRRLINGLKEKIPDLQKRIEHVLKKQVYGIAITEITALISRRSLYCSKFANGKYSVCTLPSEEGNVRFKEIKHSWKDGSCSYCGISQQAFNERDSNLESHAYEWIHITNPEEIFKMKFDVIISNPPYQLNDGGHGKSAKPIYHLFIEQAKKLNPRYMIMITPSRWLAGGKGLTSFRESMLKDKHLTKLVDYQNAKDCFPGVNISGGVSYFLWERDREDDCEFTNIGPGVLRSTMKRSLNEFPSFVRFNTSVSIIRKIQDKNSTSFTSQLSSRNPFGLATNFEVAEQPIGNDLVVYSSKGKNFVSRDKVVVGKEYINCWKVMISRVISEHALEPDKQGKYKIISTIQLLKPREVCTDSYIVGFPTKTEEEAKNCLNYLKTKFVRYLILQTLTSINLSRDQYAYVPIMDFNKSWNDASLYEHFTLTADEQKLIEETIKEM